MESFDSQDFTIKMKRYTHEAIALTTTKAESPSRKGTNYYSNQDFNEFMKNSKLVLKHENQHRVAHPEYIRAHPTWNLNRWSQGLFANVSQFFLQASGSH